MKPPPDGADPNWADLREWADEEGLLRIERIRSVWVPTKDLGPDGARVPSIRQLPFFEQTKAVGASIARKLCSREAA